MSREQDYAGFKWIKVKRHVDDESKPLEERLRALEAHHVTETTFLVDEVRKLAREIDDLRYEMRSEYNLKELIPVPPEKPVVLSNREAD